MCWPTKQFIAHQKMIANSSQTAPKTAHRHQSAHRRQSAHRHQRARNVIRTAQSSQRYCSHSANRFVRLIVAFEEVVHKHWTATRKQCVHACVHLACARHRWFIARRHHWFMHRPTERALVIAGSAPAASALTGWLASRLHCHFVGSSASSWHGK